MTHSLPLDEESLRVAYHEYIGKYGRDRAVTAMARDYGCTDKTVYRHLALTGIRPLRERRGRPPEAELRSMYEAMVAEHGVRPAIGKLAAELGVTHVTVRDWLKHYGIRMPVPRGRERREPITEPCACGAVAISRYHGGKEPLCFRCYMRTMAKDKKSSFRRATREYVFNLKNNSRCTDCGRRFPGCCLHFDHVPERGQKLFNIGNSNFSLEVTKAEIAKCDIVCANCHAIRTWNRKHPEAPVSLEPVPGASVFAVTADGKLF
jgi:hypothetical protein